MYIIVNYNNYYTIIHVPSPTKVRCDCVRKHADLRMFPLSVCRSLLTALMLLRTLLSLLLWLLLPHCLLCRVTGSSYQFVEEWRLWKTQHGRQYSSDMVCSIIIVYVLTHGSLMDHSLTHTVTHGPCSWITHSLTLTHSLTYSLTLTHSLTHTHSLT